jgi:hypothetical protein
MNEVYIVLLNYPMGNNFLGVYENSTSAVAAVSEWCENHEDDFEWFQSGSSYGFHNGEYSIRIKEFQKNFLYIDAENP